MKKKHKARRADHAPKRPKGKDNGQQQHKGKRGQRKHSAGLKGMGLFSSSQADVIRRNRELKEEQAAQENAITAANKG